MATAKTAVILCNLGAPESDTRKAIASYLKRLLSDEQLANQRSLTRSIFTSLFILPSLSKITLQLINAAAHQPESNFHSISQQQQQALQQKLGEDIKVEMIMLHGNPRGLSISEPVLGDGYDQVIILPLLPQHSVFTTSCSRHIASISANSPASATIHFIDNYHGEPDYIHALASSVQQHWKQQQRQRFLLIAFAGLPQASDDAAEPYYDQCLGTANLLATILGLSSSQWTLGFSSFHDRPTPLEPNSGQLLAAMAAQGLREIDVICPGFATDCLETRVQVEVKDRHSFLAHGGKQYRYIPCLNDRDDHIDMMAELVRPYLTAS